MLLRSDNSIIVINYNNKLMLFKFMDKKRLLNFSVINCDNYKTTQRGLD